MTFTGRSSSVSPAYFVIGEGMVVIISYAKMVISFMIEHKDVAQRYRQFFEDVWKRIGGVRRGGKKRRGEFRTDDEGEKT